MAGIIATQDPVRLTRSRPYRVIIAPYTRSNKLHDLTGCTASASLCWAGQKRPGQVGPLGSDGLITITGTEIDTADLPRGRIAAIHVALTDTRGVVHDYLCPVIGEVA